MLYSVGAIQSQRTIVTSPNGLGEGITLTNQSVWRKNSASSFTINAPTNYTINYQILDSESLIAITSGSGVTPLVVNNTFSTAMKCYDILVTIRKGSLQFERWFRRAITVLPPLFTEGTANAVWDFAAGGVTYRDNNLVDRTGYKVWCKGIYNGASYLGLEEWISSDLSNPVHIYMSPGTEIRSSGAYCMRINQNCRNILIDGCGGVDGTYGLKLSMPGTGSRAQILYIEASTNSGSTPSTAGRDIWVGGVQEDGNNISSAGLKVDTANSSTVNYDAYLANGTGALNGLYLFNILIENTVDEGLYCGYVHDNPVSGFTHVPIVGARIYRFQTNATGGDGMQMGASLFDSEIHHCTVTNAGTRNDANHKNGMQFSSGNRNCFLYQNRINSTKNLFSLFTGRGGSSNEFFGNVFINPTTSGNVNTFIVIYPNDYFTNLSYKFYNNTYILSNTSEPFEVWNLNVPPQPANQPTMNPFVSADNLVIANNANQYKTINGVDQTGWIVNANYQTSNISAPLFVNAGAANYDIGSLSSPAFQARHSFTKGHPLSNYDTEGVKFVADVHGGYSGYKLMT